MISQALCTDEPPSSLIGRSSGQYMMKIENSIQRLFILGLYYLY